MVVPNKCRSMARRNLLGFPDAKREKQPAPTRDPGTLMPSWFKPAGSCFLYQAFTLTIEVAGSCFPYNFYAMAHFYEEVSPWHGW